MKICVTVAVWWYNLYSGVEGILGSCKHLRNRMNAVSPPVQLHGCALDAMWFKKFCISLLHPKSTILLYRGSSEIHIWLQRFGTTHFKILKMTDLRQHGMQLLVLWRKQNVPVMGYGQTVVRVNGEVLITKWMEDMWHSTNTKLIQNWISSYHNISYHLLYSINPLLCTDTTGCGTCQGSIYNIVTHDYYTYHIVKSK